MNQRIAPFVLVLLTLTSVQKIPAQPPLRSATIAVLQSLNLSDEKALAERLQEQNRRIRKKGLQELGTEYALLSGDDRTLYFSLLYLSYYGLAGYGLPNARAFLERQHSGGFIPAQVEEEKMRPVVPFLAQIIVLGAKQRNHFLWLQDQPDGKGLSYYERLKHYLDYWSTQRDADENGLPSWEWGIVEGLFDVPASVPEGKVMQVESVALACLLHREYKAMALLAHQLHRRADIQLFEQRAEAVAGALNAYCWEEQDGFYYDREEESGKLLPGKSAAGLLPLFAGMASYERADRLVGHLQKEGTFWTIPPLPLVSGIEQAANTEAILQWRICIPANYMVFQGLMDYGYRDLAKALARETFNLPFRQNEKTRPRYDALTGEGRGKIPPGGWSALAYLIPWEGELNYTPSTLSWQPLIPLARDYLGVTFEKP